MKRLFTLLGQVCVIWVLLGMGDFVYGQATVVRGPYLQMPRSDGMMLCWRTDVATDSEVRFGTDLANLDQVVVDTVQTTEHRVDVSGLQPFTKYYYSVGTSTEVLEGGNEAHYFVSSPTIGTDQPIRAWVTGDFGKGNQGQIDVKQSFLDYTGDDHTDLWLWLGDNVYDSGTDEEFQQKVFDSIYGYHHIFKYLPFMPIPGNHDYLSINLLDDPEDHVGPYYDIVEVPTNGEIGGVPSGYELYYSYDYGSVHFIALNSEIIAWTGAVPFPPFVSSPMSEWLEQDLQANDKDWVVVYFHQPPYSKGSHDSDDIWELLMEAMRENFLPILEQYGVDLVLSGHSHAYERSYLIKGHYGNSGSWNASTMLVDGSSGNDAVGEAYVKYKSGPNANEGTVYAVVGNSGSKTDDAAGSQHPAMFKFDYGNDVYGSLILDIDGNRLDGKYLRSTGVIEDSFTILKMEGAASLDGFDAFGELDIYPNPFKDQVQVNYTLDVSADIGFALYDLYGKLVHKVDNKVLGVGSYKEVLNLGDLSSGTYVLEVLVDDVKVQSKVVKY